LAPCSDSIEADEGIIGFKMRRNMILDWRTEAFEGMITVYLTQFNYHVFFSGFLLRKNTDTEPERSLLWN